MSKLHCQWDSFLMVQLWSSPTFHAGFNSSCRSFAPRPNQTLTLFLFICRATQIWSKPALNDASRGFWRSPGIIWPNVNQRLKFHTLPPLVCHPSSEPETPPQNQIKVKPLPELDSTHWWSGMKERRCTELNIPRQRSSSPARYYKVLNNLNYITVPWI